MVPQGAEAGPQRSLGWVDGTSQVTKPPLSLHRAGQTLALAWSPGWARQGGLSGTAEAQGCRSLLCTQNYYSLGPPSASEKGCLCCASWSNRPLHKSKTMGGALTIWCPAARRASLCHCQDRGRGEGCWGHPGGLNPAWEPGQKGRRAPRGPPPTTLLPPRELRPREGMGVAEGSANKDGA